MKKKHYANGVTLNMHPDSRGYYRVYWTENGEPKDARRSTLHEAEQVAEQKSYGLTSDGKVRKEDVTVAELYELQVEDMADEWSEGHIQRLDSAMRGRILPIIGAVAVRRWDEEHTQRVIDTIAKDLAPSTVGLYRNYMSSLAAWGYENRYHDGDPMRGVRAPKKENGQVRDLPTQDNVDALARTIGNLGEDNGHRSVQIQLAATTGLRAGEMLGLHVEQFDFEAGTILVDRQNTQHTAGLTKPKGGKVRTTVFPTWMDWPIQHRIEQVGGEGPLWPAQQLGACEPYRTFYGYFKRAVDACDAWRDKWTYHWLRHHAASWMLAPKPDGLGLSPAEVATLLGHSSVSTTLDMYVGSMGNIADKIRRNDT